MVAGLEQAVGMVTGCGMGLRVLNIAGLVLTCDLLEALAVVSIHVCVFIDAYTHIHAYTYIDISKKKPLHFVSALPEMAPATTPSDPCIIL
jgi:hypothetical protein